MSDFKIPQGWQVEYLKDLSTDGIKNGVFNDPKKVGEGAKLINVVNLYSGAHINTEKLTRLNLTEQEIAKYKVEVGDVFFTRSSLVLNGIAQCNINLDDSDDIVFDGHVMRVRPNSKKVVPFYLKEFCLSDSAKKFFMRHAKTTTMTTIGQEEVGKLPVLLPPKEEQEKIVSILSSWDKAIELKEKLIEQKKEQKKGLMQRLIPGETRLSGFNNEWKTYKIGEICDYQNGTALEKYFNDSDGLKVISIGNYSIDGNYRENKVFINTINEQTEKYILNKNDLTMVLNDKTSTGDIIGRVILIDEENKYIFNQRTMRLTVKSDLAFSPFLHQLINSDIIHKKIVALAKGGTQIYINTSDVLNMQLQLPSLEEQKKIYSVLNCMDNEIKLLNKELDLLLNQKKGLMQLLLTGKVRVKV